MNKYCIDTTLVINYYKNTKKTFLLYALSVKQKVNPYLIYFMNVLTLKRVEVALLIFQNFNGLILILEDTVFFLNCNTHPQSINNALKLVCLVNITFMRLECFRSHLIFAFFVLNYNI